MGLFFQCCLMGRQYILMWMDHSRGGEPSTCTRTSDFLEHQDTTDVTQQTPKTLSTSGSEAQTSALSFALCWVPCYSLYISLDFCFQKGSSLAGRLLVLSDLRPSSVSWRQPPRGLAEWPRPPIFPRLQGGGCGLALVPRSMPAPLPQAP